MITISKCQHGMRRKRLDGKGYFESPCAMSGSRLYTVSKDSKIRTEKGLGKCFMYLCLKHVKSVENAGYTVLEYKD